MWLEWEWQRFRSVRQFYISQDRHEDYETFETFDAAYVDYNSGEDSEHGSP